MSMNRDDQKGPFTERTEPMGRGGVGQSSMIGPAPESPRFSSQSSQNVQRSVELHLEELVLHGFAPGDRYRIGEAIERELTRLFTEQGAPIAIMRDGETENVDGGALQIETHSTADEIGAPIARAIYGGLI